MFTYVKHFKTVFRILRLILFAFMFSVCMLLGVIPIIPKGKEQPEIEIKITEEETIETESEERQKAL